MSVEEREEIIEQILMCSIWNREALGKLSNRRLLEEYDKYLKLR